MKKRLKDKFKSISKLRSNIKCEQSKKIDENLYIRKDWEASTW